jgi:hypothetical protein
VTEVPELGEEGCSSGVEGVKNEPINSSALTPIKGVKSLIAFSDPKRLNNLSPIALVYLPSKSFSNVFGAYVLRSWINDSRA